MKFSHSDQDRYKTLYKKFSPQSFDYYKKYEEQPILYQELSILNEKTNKFEDEHSGEVFYNPRKELVKYYVDGEFYHQEKISIKKLIVSLETKENQDKLLEELGYILNDIVYDYVNQDDE